MSTLERWLHLPAKSNSFLIVKLLPTQVIVELLNKRTDCVNYLVRFSYLSMVSVHLILSTTLQLKEYHVKHYLRAVI